MIYVKPSGVLRKADVVFGECFARGGIGMCVYLRRVRFMWCVAGGWYRKVDGCGEECMISGGVWQRDGGGDGRV